MESRGRGTYPAGHVICKALYFWQVRTPSAYADWLNVFPHPLLSLWEGTFRVKWTEYHSVGLLYTPILHSTYQTRQEQRLSSGRSLVFLRSSRWNPHIECGRFTAFLSIILLQSVYHSILCSLNPWQRHPVNHNRCNSRRPYRIFHAIAVRYAIS